MVIISTINQKPEKVYKYTLMIEIHGSEPEYFEITTNSPYKPLEIDYIADMSLATGGVGTKSTQTPVEAITNRALEQIRSKRGSR